MYQNAVYGMQTKIVDHPRLFLEPHHGEISRYGPLLLLGEKMLPCLILSKLSSWMHFETILRFIDSVKERLLAAIWPLY